MGSTFGGSKVSVPPPPPPSTVRDEVGGVEQVPITNLNGSVTYVTRRLPLTAEQQAKKDEMDAILSGALGEIKKLSAADYAPDAETKKVLDQWGEIQGRLLKEGFGKRAETEEEALARRGLADSTAGLAIRRARTLDEQDANRNMALEKDVMAEQIRGEKLGLQQNLYNIASSQVEADQARAFESAVRGQSAVAAINAQRTASLLDYYDRAEYARKNKMTVWRALGTSVANAMGGNTGGGGSGGGGSSSVVGGFLGSMFKR